MHVTPPLPAPPRRPSAGSHWPRRRPSPAGRGRGRPSRRRAGILRPDGALRPDRLAGGRAEPGPLGCCGAIEPGCGQRHGERGLAGWALGPGGDLQEGKGQPSVGYGRARGGLAAGRGSRGGGGGAASGEGLFRIAAPAGGGSLSAALRRDQHKGGGGGRRPCGGERVSPSAVHASLRGPQRRAPASSRALLDTSGFFLNNGGGGGPGSSSQIIRRAPAGRDGVRVLAICGLYFAGGETEDPAHRLRPVPSAVTARRGDE